MRMTLNASLGPYDVVVEQGLLHRLSDELKGYRRCMVVTDSGVPSGLLAAVTQSLNADEVFVIEQGESHKSFATLERLLERLCQETFTKADCLVAVGGGVVCDVTGLAASLYWRGMDHFLVPTTLLAAVDACVGGKTAVNLAGYKNQIGHFYPPKGVWIDVSCFDTLPECQKRNGMAEVIKMAVTLDADFFADLERSGRQVDWKDIVERCVKLKAAVVQADEREQGLRRVLNFGHTVGHALESVCPELSHGDCVALGMLCCCDQDLKERLIRLYRCWDLPVTLPVPLKVLKQALYHDKKGNGEVLTIVYADAPGRYRFLPNKIEAFT